MENRGPGEASTSGQDQGMAVELDNVVFGYDPRPCEDTQTTKTMKQYHFFHLFSPSCMAIVMLTNLNRRMMWSN